MTTSELLFSIEEAYAYLRQADRILGDLIGQVGPYTATRRSDPYSALLRTILHQQLAGPAASAIERRWLALYGSQNKAPTPEQLLTTTDEEFRSCGVSRQKAGYMRDLALHVIDSRLDFAELTTMPDAEVIGRVTAVKGLGEWSAQMFLMFHLGRPDVLPVGDLGVRNGMRRVYALDNTPTPRQAQQIGAPWAPFRSVGSWYMWRVT